MLNAQSQMPNDPRLPPILPHLPRHDIGRWVDCVGEPREVDAGHHGGTWS